VSQACSTALQSMWSQVNYCNKSQDSQTVIDSTFYFVLEASWEPRPRLLSQGLHHWVYSIQTRTTGNDSKSTHSFISLLTLLFCPYWRELFFALSYSYSDYRCKSVSLQWLLRDFTVIKGEKAKSNTCCNASYI